MEPERRSPVLLAALAYSDREIIDEGRADVRPGAWPPPQRARPILGERQLAIGKADSRWRARLDRILEVVLDDRPHWRHRPRRRS
ncbi:MAG: hypothetical protein AB1679_34265 [Actinomycetota bacterium]